LARSRDKFRRTPLQGCPDNDIRMTNREFHEATAAMFCNTLPIYKEHLAHES
jgi:hypothetical protein